MLITCPECELQVSDKAKSCPHCGYPINEPSSPRKSNRKAHMRLPNGFGQITELKGKNYRNPFRAMVTVGKNSNGRPICKLLKPQSYFATYNEAYQALMEYNKNPYDLENDIRLFELYERWSAEYFKTLKSDSSQRTIKSAWNYCKPMYDMRVKDIRARHIKGCLDQEISANIKSRIKSVMNIMLDYAVEYEIVDRNYARTFNVSDDIVDEMAANKKDHIAFTDDELSVLWKNVTVPFVDVILIQCYSGWRPQELCNLKNENVKDLTFTGGMKTDAGTDRTVPIHSSILNLVNNRISDKEWLFYCEDGSRLTYDKYRRRFENIMRDLNLNPEHKPHDPRKTFVTMAKKYNVDEYAIKRIVGHNISDITESVYTERNIDWLGTEIEKIK